MVKALITFEGVGQILLPGFDVAEVSERHVRRIFIRQFSPLRLVQEELRGAPDLVDALVKVPLLVTEGLRVLEKTTRRRTENPFERAAGHADRRVLPGGGRHHHGIRRAPGRLGRAVRRGIRSSRCAGGADHARTSLDADLAADPPAVEPFDPEFCRRCIEEGPGADLGALFPPRIFGALSESPERGTGDPRRESQRQRLPPRRDRPRRGALAARTGSRPRRSSARCTRRSSRWSGGCAPSAWTISGGGAAAWT